MSNGKPADRPALTHDEDYSIVDSVWRSSVAYP